jgi:hypothetical protein
MDGYSDHPSCEQAADRWAKRAKEGKRDWAYSCLPDTVDPRGVKGK